ncbi:hypothetical protein [Candidatus Clostridium stratigraminis]|uniref:PLAT domain-containing protein n=1 Tax=Candidatus Clostridium stratigraminis TaxID=3381661 RepID=A0ABW8T4K6_9CLOT
MEIQCFAIGNISSFGHEATLFNAEVIVNAVKGGELKHFFVNRWM